MVCQGSQSYKTKHIDSWKVPDFFNLGVGVGQKSVTKSASVNWKFLVSIRTNVITKFALYKLLGTTCLPNKHLNRA